MLLDSAPLLSDIEAKGIIPVIYIKNQWDKALLPSRYQDTDLIYTYKGYDKPTRLYVTD